MMMTSMKRKVAAMLAAVSLMTVATGALADYGDAEKDKGDEPRYKVGDYVEVYNSTWHITTKRSKILQAGKNPEGVWEYIVEPAHGKKSNVSADHIESND